MATTRTRNNPQPCGCPAAVRNNMPSPREAELRVGFWNVRRTGDAMDAGLQQAADLDLDIFFLAEVHLDGKIDRTLQVKKHTGYSCVSSLAEGTKVVGYVGDELIGSMEILWEENNMVVIRVGDVRVGGVYWQPEWRTEETEERLAELGRRLGDGKRVVMGDWNAHHELWACEGTQGNARGRKVVEWMDESGLYLGSTKGVTTRQQGEDTPAVIDFTLVSDLEEWEEGEDEEWGLSNHQLIWGTLKVEVQKDAVRKVVDWDRLKELVKSIQEGQVEEEDRWYDELLGDSPYDKMKSLFAQLLKTSRQGKWAKRW